MSDDEVFEIELPHWVQALLSTAGEEGYRRGFEEGQKALWYEFERRLQMAKPYGA